MRFAQSYKITIIALALCAVGFIACSDSDSSSDANGEDNVLSIKLGETPVNGGVLLLGKGESFYELNLESNGEWRIENNSTFIDSVLPESGLGNADVKIHVKKNDSEGQRKGELRVVFPKDTSLNTVIDLRQMYSGDYEDNDASFDSLEMGAIFACSFMGLFSKEAALQCLTDAFEKSENYRVDPRDGKMYKTTVIKSQVWMAENLRYDSEGGHTYCFNDDKANCRKYGRLYNYYAAKNACPDGWHLPSKAEWLTLINELGGEAAAGKALKSTSGWKSEGNGNDDYKFSALPVGYSIKDTYYSMDEETQFWASTGYGGNYFYLVSLNFDNDSAAVRPRADRYGLSVRCLKD